MRTLVSKHFSHISQRNEEGIPEVDTLRFNTCKLLQLYLLFHMNQSNLMCFNRNNTRKCFRKIFCSCHCTLYIYLMHFYVFHLNRKGQETLCISFEIIYYLCSQYNKVWKTIYWPNIF